MELFKFTGEPNGDGIDFELLPSEELKKQLSPEWITELQDEISDSFVDILYKKSTISEPGELIKIANFSIKSSFDGKTLVENKATNYMDWLISNMDEGSLKAYQILTNNFMQKVAKLSDEYIDNLTQLTDKEMFEEDIESEIID